MGAKPVGVPEKVTLILDNELRALIAAAMRDGGHTNVSRAIREALHMSFAANPPTGFGAVTPEIAARRIALREEALAARAIVKARLDRAIAEIFEANTAENS